MLWLSPRMVRRQMAPTHLLLKMLLQQLDPPLLIHALRDFNCYYELTLLCYICVISCTKELEDILRTCTREISWEKPTFTEGPTAWNLEPVTSCSCACTEPQSPVLYSQSRALDPILAVLKQVNVTSKESPVLCRMAVTPARCTQVPNERCMSVTPEDTDRAHAHHIMQWHFLWIFVVRALLASYLSFLCHLSQSATSYFHW